MSTSSDKNKCSFLYIPFEFPGVINFANNIDPDDLLRDDKVISRDNVIEFDQHITVKYGLPLYLMDENNQESQLFYNKLRDYFKKGIKINMKSISSFKNKDKKFDDGSLHSYDVLILPVESEELKIINKEISDTFNIPNTHGEFKGHLTIGYLEYEASDKYIELWKDNIPDDSMPKNIQINEFCLKISGDREIKPIIIKNE
jgi:2'-5' RNA ligase